MPQRKLQGRLAFQMLEDRHLLSAVAFVEHGRIALDHIVHSIDLADFDNDGLTDILANGYEDLIGHHLFDPMPSRFNTGRSTSGRLRDRFRVLANTC